MQYPKNLFFALTATVLFSSCGQESDTSGLNKIKLENKTQVKDVLQGKSKAEILHLKYKELKASCNLITQKMLPPQMSESAEAPVENPTQSSFTYDLKLQQIVDQDLTQEVKTTLISSLDKITLKVNLTFKPLFFQEALNLEINQTKYAMKHTPVLSYTAVYKILRERSSTFGTTEAKIYEKIDSQRNTIVDDRVGEESYKFSLDCKLDRIINTANRDLAAEFESQWVIIDCKAPQNDIQKSICIQ